MQHPDPDDLALIALGESLGDAVDTHVAGCAECSAEVESLRLTVGLADLSNYGEDAARPGEHVWQAIAAELGFGGAERASSGSTVLEETSGDLLSRTASAPSNGGPGNGRSTDLGPLLDGSGPADQVSSLDHAAAEDHGRSVPPGTSIDQGAVTPPGLRAVPGTGSPTPPAGSGSGSSAKRWPRWAVPLAAAVVGIAVGAGAVVISQNRADQVTVEATAPLTPVPGGPLAGDQQLGTAEIVADSNVQQVRVQAADLPPTSNDYEVWLFGDDDRMVSLGTLNNGSGTFTVPQGISTQEYRVIDVSDEPPDGVPTHSGVSLVRGEFS
ncbi:MAG: anti-sigma factor [Nakamurella sp.]